MDCAAANNSSFTMSVGDGDIGPFFARARHVTRLSLNNNRVTAVTMEPRGCIAEYDPGTRRYTLYTSTQNVHGVRQTPARQILHVPESRIRVIARNVGGGFGMKGLGYLAFGTSHECDANFYQRVLAEDGCAWRNARHPARRKGAGIGSLCVGHAQTEMQQGALGALLLRSSSPTFGLNRRRRSEHLKVTSVAGIEECSAIDASLHRELVTNCEREAFGIEP